LKHLRVKPVGRGSTFAVAMILVAAGCGQRTPSAPASTAGRAFGHWKMIDLTHPLAGDGPVFPGGTPFQLQQLENSENGYAQNRFTTGEHTGTHIDAPSHISKGSKSIDAVPLQDLSGPIALIDISAKAGQNSEALLTVDDIQASEQRDGAISARSFVLVRTGWSKRWSNPQAYLNADAKKVLHFPGVSVEAARFLLKERKVLGIGIDTPSVDPGTSTDFAEHHVLLQAGMVNLENLDHLEALPARGAYLFAAALPIKGGTGAPARVFALVAE
jgi:kynurenine formamidase